MKIASSKMGRVRFFVLVGKFDDSARTEPQKSVLSTPHGNCEPAQNGTKSFLKENSYFYFSSAFSFVPFMNTSYRKLYSRLRNKHRGTLINF